MGIDNESTGSALKNEMHLSYPVRDEVTGETVTDPDGFPIAELESDDYLELANNLTIEERSRGERAWRFGHVIVDEAQDLTPMQWRMVSRRARGRSMTIVGDVAQRTVGSQPHGISFYPTSSVKFDASTCRPTTDPQMRSRRGRRRSCERSTPTSSSPSLFGHRDTRST